MQNLNLLVGATDRYDAALHVAANELRVAEAAGTGAGTRPVGAPMSWEYWVTAWASLVLGLAAATGGTR